ncbi:MAG: hypothetical protein Q4D38_09315 [Planctomycetia bacterium]|nr:hypothetical protein [Planctomycetia bacterium]
MIPPILVVGAPVLDEFEWVLDFLARQGETLVCEESAQSLIERVAQEALIPRLTLLWRPVPERDQSSEALALKRAFPISPLLSILGSWCEGEGRTGSPEKNASSLMWYDFVTMFPLEKFAWSHDFSSVWNLPESALPDAQIRWALRRSQHLHLEPIPPCATWVETDDFELFRFFRDALSPSPTFGSFSTFDELSLCVDDRVRRVVFDCPDWTPATQSCFVEVRARFPRAQVFAFLEFPRSHEWRQLEEFGAARVFPKPFRLDDFYFAISELEST